MGRHGDVVAADHGDVPPGLETEPAHALHDAQRDHVVAAENRGRREAPSDELGQRLVARAPRQEALDLQARGVRQSRRLKCRAVSRTRIQGIGVAVGGR